LRAKGKRPTGIVAPAGGPCEIEELASPDLSRLAIAIACDLVALGRATSAERRAREQREWEAEVATKFPSPLERGGITSRPLRALNYEGLR
jgi:hypothetical protein